MAATTGQGSKTVGVGKEAPAKSRALLDIAGVAVRLNITERYVRRLVQERRIPFLKWGHFVRFDPDEIERWLTTCRVPEGGSLDFSPATRHNGARST